MYRTAKYKNRKFQMKFNVVPYFYDYYILKKVKIKKFRKTVVQSRIYFAKMAINLQFSFQLVIVVISG